MTFSRDDARQRLTSMPLDKERFSARLKRSLAAMQEIKPSLLCKEPDLTFSAHPDYRFMTPDERTDLFTEQFARQYSLSFRENVNHVDAHKMTGLMRSATRYLGAARSRKTKVSREYSSLWSQRQFADLLGLTYEFFIRAAFESHLNVARKIFPRPNQLVTGKGAGIVLQYILDKSEKDLGLNNNISYSGVYREEYYIGLPAQDTHRRDVLKWAKAKGEHAARFVVANSLLPLESLTDEYGPEVLERLKSYVASDTTYFKSLAPVKKNELFPGCFRIPLTYNKESEICQACLFRKQCNNVQEVYLDDRKSNNLSINDYKTHRLNSQNLRQQKRRANLSANLS